jgi:hypothetical protein
MSRNLGSYFREFRKIFWVKILKFLDADPGSGMGKIRIRDKHPRSVILFLNCLVSLRQKNSYSPKEEQSSCTWKSKSSLSASPAFRSISAGILSCTDLNSHLCCRQLVTAMLVTLKIKSLNGLCSRIHRVNRPRPLSHALPICVSISFLRARRIE